MTKELQNKHRHLFNKNSLSNFCLLAWHWALEIQEWEEHRQWSISLWTLHDVGGGNEQGIKKKKKKKKKKENKKNTVSTIQ